MPPTFPVNTTAAHRLLIATLLLLPAACASYEPAPLDPEAARQAWLVRSPDDEGVREFARRLAAAHHPSQEFNAADGITLAEAEAIGLVFNRELRVVRRGAGVAQATADFAGLWDDPVLGIEIERIVQSVPNPWIVGAAIGITIPISGRVEALQRRADEALRAELDAIASREWSHRATIRRRWMEWSAQRLREELLRELVREVDAVAISAQRLEAAGVLARVDARLFQVELAGRRAELLLVEAEGRELELLLRDALGLAPEAPVEFVPQVVLEPATDPTSAREAWLKRNPALRAMRSHYAVAEAALELEVRRQYPDITIGPGYKEDQGDGRVLLGISLPLPLWNRNQQGVAEAFAERDRVREEFYGLLESIESQLEVALVRVEMSRAARLSLDRDLLPLVDLQDAEVRRSAELGRVDPLLLLETLRSRYDARLRVIDTRLAESISSATQDELVGPPRSALEDAPS
ncbi:MAG: TolC family protein [Phycisphaeraceae bacterium]|nr:TolC family protein [Phycisphaeraceae bacterium]